MSVPEEKINALMKKSSEAAELISKRVREGGFIHVASHLDADGLAAAGIIGKALLRLEASFRIRIQHWIDEEIMKELASEKPDLIIFTDLGSGYLDILAERLKNQRLLILDHHQPIGEASSTCLHVNPHLYEIDGSKDLSGAGVTYFVAKALDETNIDLACVALVGALGDLQDKYAQRSLGGANQKIVEDAVNAGYLKVEKDLIFFGRETRQIHKALAYTTNPFIPGISGEEDKSLAFLVSLGIAPKKGEKWRALRDLTEEEKKKLCSALADYLLSKGLSSSTSDLIGHVYTLIREEPWTPTRDAREFAVLLNATGRMDKPGLGVSICMGDRTSALEEANKVLEEYRRTITKYLNWLTQDPKHIEELSNIYVVHGENYIDEKVIGTISSILSTTLPKLEKPIIAYATVPREDTVKLSARTVDVMTRKGLNLGEILRVAAEKCLGQGGGHDIAAGAQVPLENLETFIKLVNKLVKEELEKKRVGS